MTTVLQELRVAILELNAQAARAQDWDRTEVYLAAARQIDRLSSPNPDDGLALRSIYEQFARNAGDQSYTPAYRDALQQLLALLRATGKGIGVDVTKAPEKPKTRAQELRELLSTAEVELSIWVQDSAAAESIGVSKSLSEALHRVQALHILIDSEMGKRH